MCNQLLEQFKIKVVLSMGGGREGSRWCQGQLALPRITKKHRTSQLFKKMNLEGWSTSSSSRGFKDLRSTPRTHREVYNHL